MTMSTATANQPATSAVSPVVPPPARRGVLAPWLRAQALNLERHTRALRPFTRQEFGSAPEVPSEGHIQAVNALIEKLRGDLVDGAQRMWRLAARAVRRPDQRHLEAVVDLKHRAHRRVLAIEKVWDFYFELFGQRQTRYGTWLMGCDRIALDCYQNAYVGIGVAKSIPAPPPFSYMRTGFGPATYRRAIRMSKLGQQPNPFPLVHLPYHRLVNPWTLGAILHEVSHNLHNDLGLSLAVPRAIGAALLKAGVPRRVAAVWVRWNRETFADMSGLLLGGPAIVASLMDVVGRATSLVFNYDPKGVHPTPYLRVLISTELLRRMGFPEESKRYAEAWAKLYSQPTAGTIPSELLSTAPVAIPLVVEAICYRKYPEIGNKALSEVFRFAPKEQHMVEEAARRLAAGTDPGIVPERFLIGAARVALDQRLAEPEVLKENFYRELGRR
jgi:hypothetical protein